MDKTLQGHTALVTGASSGLGVDFAGELAARGCGLVLVARRADRLEQVAADLRSRHGIEVRVVVMDLSTDGAGEALERRLADDGVQVDVLVNNAGFGLYGRDLDLPWDRVRQMLMLDMVTLTELTRRFAAPMVRRGRGWILQVSSIGAYQPSPTYAAYSAAKAYVLSYGQALNHELRGTGVSCTTVCPGITATEFLEVSGQERTWYQRMMLMDSPTVARIGIRAMLKRRYSVVPGFLNWISALSMKVTPAPLATAMVARLMKN